MKSGRYSFLTTRKQLAQISINLKEVDNKKIIIMEINELIKKIEMKYSRLNLITYAENENNPLTNESYLKVNQ